MRLRKIVPFVAVAVVLAGAGLAPGKSKRSYVGMRGPDSEGTPFSAGVMAGDTLYVSGKLGLNADGSVPDDPAAEAHNVLKAVQATLEEAGMTMDDLVQVQVFCSDVAHYDVWNRVYRTYFKEAFPARAFVGSGTLLRGARFEMLGVAVRR